MYIVIEPVTMPCGHELCRPCFQQNVQEANLSCPMCRTRISTWTRKATRDNKLVNEKRWKQIKEAFPDKVQRRLDGKEEVYSSDDEEDTLPQQYFQLAEDGAIRKEYEEQLKQLEEERLRAVQEEEVKSRQLIAQLEEEEKRALREKQKRSHEDEQVARELASQIKSETDKKRQLRSESALDRFVKKTQRNTDGTLPEDVYPFTCLSPSDKIPKYCASPGSLRDSDMFLEDREDSFAHSEDYLYLAGPNNKGASALGLGIDIKLTDTPFSAPCSSTRSSVIVIGSSPGSSISTPGTSKKASKTKLDKWLARKSSTPPPKSLLSSFKSCSNIPKALEEESTSVSPATFFAGTSKSPSVSKSPQAMNRTQSNDSLGQEMVHFKPIQACPITPPKKQPGGKGKHPPVIRSTPVNLNLKLSREGAELGPTIPITSPVVKRSLQFLAAQRQAHVSAFSKATLTEDKPLPKLSEQAYWSPKKNRIVTVQQDSSTSPDSPVTEPQASVKNAPALPKLPRDLVIIDTSPSLPTSSNSSPSEEDTITLTVQPMKHRENSAKVTDMKHGSDDDRHEDSLIAPVVMPSEDAKDDDVPVEKVAETPVDTKEMGGKEDGVEPVAMNEDEKDDHEPVDARNHDPSDSFQKSESQSLIGSQSQTITSSQGKVYKMKRKTNAKRTKRKPVVCPLPGSKYDVESWLKHCTESESSMEAAEGETDAGKDGEAIASDCEKPNAVSFTNVKTLKRKRKKACDAESVASTVSTRSTRSTARAKANKAKSQKVKEQKSVEKGPVEKKISNNKKCPFGDRVFSDGEKENSVDSFDFKVARPKNSQDAIVKAEDQEVEPKGRGRLKSKRATADLEFTSGSPKKKKRMVEYSPTHNGKKPMQRKGLQTKLTHLLNKTTSKDEPQTNSPEKESSANDFLPEEISSQLKDLHEDRLKPEDFDTEEAYTAYIEEQDRLLALKLQADFDFEARFHLNAVRRKGSGEEYQLRRGKRKTNYTQFFSPDAGVSNRRPTRAKRK